MSKMDDKSLFLKAGASPRRFYLRSLGAVPDIPNVTVKPPKNYGYTEKDLHPFLAYYAQGYLKTYTKTIRHYKSGKTDYGEWAHPDIVGCNYPLNDWKPEVADLCTYTRNSSMKLLSFELKRELNNSTLREAFFQTVSNSSWAHESYLVAETIQDDEDFYNELKRLSQSFGIGIIKINIKDPDSTEILFPAKLKEYLDWETINKLASMNSDFDEFIKRVKNDLQTKEVREEEYDEVLDREKLINSIKNS